MLKVKVIVAWYDVWIGFYFDRSRKTLYFFPVPFIGLKIHYHKSKRVPVNFRRKKYPKATWKFPYQCPFCYGIINHPMDNFKHGRGKCRKE